MTLACRKETRKKGSKKTRYIVEILHGGTGERDRCLRAVEIWMNSFCDPVTVVPKMIKGLLVRVAPPGRSLCMRPRSYAALSYTPRGIAGGIAGGIAPDLLGSPD